MKRFVLLILCILMVPAFAFAEPVLTCDPQYLTNPDGTTWHPTKYRVRLSPTSTWLEAPSTADGAAWFQLNAWPAGRYPQCEMQAGGEVAITDSTTGIRTVSFVWSASAPFVYEKLIGNTPANLVVFDYRVP